MYKEELEITDRLLKIAPNDSNLLNARNEILKNIPENRQKQSYCINCGQKLGLEDKFCVNCGTKI